VSLWDRVADLPLSIEGYELETLTFSREQFVRKTTVIHLQGGGEEGIGEDITYVVDVHDAAAAAGPVLPLSGTWTIESFSAQLDQAGVDEDYTRWGYESAALDLALRQSGTSLADAVERRPSPLTFVVSTRGDIREWLALSPTLRFKVDARNGWTDEVVAEIASTGAVDVVDLKGHYEGEWVDADPEPGLYRRVVEAFPRAYIEDAWLDEGTDPVLEPHRQRLTWDAPIHSVADVEALPFPPLTLNSKPSRFGTVRRLVDFYDYCAERGISLYGGGQFELGPGRGQIQLLASLFHPDGPNDVAPAVYNLGGARPGLPTSPLESTPRPTGFLLATT
jgi:hypothetical protein